MIQLIPINFLRFFLLVILQVFFFSKLEVHPFINIFIYPLFILLLPFETPRMLQMLLGFFIGLLVDFFLGSMGMHAACGLLIGYFRKPLLDTISPKGAEYELAPNIHLQGFSWFLFYFFVLYFIHHFFYFLIESWSFYNLFILLLKTLTSVFFTIFFSIVIVFLFTRDRKRRLG